MQRMAALMGCLVLFGCARGSPWGEGADTVTRPFASRAQIAWEQTQYDAEIEKRADGSIHLWLTSEDLCSPVEFSCQGGGASVASGGIVLTLDARELPPYGLAASIRQALTALESAQFEQQGEDLALMAGRVSLVVEKEGRAFQTLGLERGRVDFSDFKFLD